MAHAALARGRCTGYVYIGAHGATFIGLAAEHEIGNDSHGNREYDGWYTVAWTRDGAT